MKRIVKMCLLALCMLWAVLLPVKAQADETTLTKLDAPTELKWGYTTEWKKGEQVLVEQPGTICFKIPERHQSQYKLVVYNVENDSKVITRTDSMDSIGGNYKSTYEADAMWYLTTEFGKNPNLESGTYYFTVQTLGDGIEYSDSEVVRSENWTYVAPEAKLETPANLTKTGTEFTCDAVKGAWRYGFCIRYAATEDATPKYSSGEIAAYRSATFTDYACRYGAGYYSVGVCAISGDITQARSSDWSEEIVFYYDPAVEEVNDSLSKIVNTATTAQQIKSSVQALDADTLKIAMETDTDNSGAVGLLTQLEDKVGGAADVAVSKDVPAIAADKVSIVGANLNTTTGKVTLNIAKPEKEHVLDTLYNSALAVNFSMDLENVEDTENLQVPVEITLPIPSNINPSFLVLLHYHADGTMDRIWPNITHQDGQAYASFVLTSFSDFVLTQGIEPEVNRIAGSGRWDTAIKVADELKATLGVEKFSSIIVASGNDFADALAGSYLSTQKRAPILLSWGKGGKYASLDTDNINYIRNNLTAGGTVYILGGTSAVPSSYETDLSGIKVVRLAGGNRYETNLAILKEAGVADGSEILVCTGVTFADSLSAAATGKPILLVQEYNGKVYGIDAAFLNGHNYTFTIIGGAKAVGDNLKEKLGRYGEVTRLSGDNRMDTSVKVAERYFTNPDSAVVAYAWNYPDGLCGGALAYAMHAPLILTMEKWESAAVAYVDENNITTGYVLGGAGLVSDSIVREIFGMAEDAKIPLK